MSLNRGIGREDFENYTKQRNYRKKNEANLKI